MTDIQRLQQNSFAIRGRFLETAIQLEKRIEFIIGRHFCETNDEIDEIIMVIIAPRVSFSQKKDILDYLFDLYYNEFKTKHSSILNRLEKIIKWRNIFAHWSLDFSEKSMKAFNDNHLISFVKLKNYKADGVHYLGDVTSYSELDINTMISEMNEYVEVLDLFLKEQASPISKKKPRQRDT